MSLRKLTESIAEEVFFPVYAGVQLFGSRDLASDLYVRFPHSFRELRENLSQNRTFGIGFENGGPSGVVYTFLIVWAGTLATFISLAELSSMVPTAGGQYHWVSILAPPFCQKLFSYVVGMSQQQPNF